MRLFDKAGVIVPSFFDFKSTYKALRTQMSEMSDIGPILAYEAPV